MTVNTFYKITEDEKKIKTAEPSGKLEELRAEYENRLYELKMCENENAELADELKRNDKFMIELRDIYLQKRKKLELLDREYVELSDAVSYELSVINKELNAAEERNSENESVLKLLPNICRPIETDNLPNKPDEDLNCNSSDRDVKKLLFDFLKKKSKLIYDSYDTYSIIGCESFYSSYQKKIEKKYENVYDILKQKNEDIFLLVDLTAFGSAKNFLVFTSEKYYYKDYSSKVISGFLKSVEIKESSNKICLKDGDLIMYVGLCTGNEKSIKKELFEGFLDIVKNN